MIKLIPLAAVLISPFLFTGCETLVAERGPGYRRPVVYQEGYYADDRSRNPYRDRRDYRDRDEVRVVRSNDGAYYRPTPVVRENIVVVNRPKNGRTKKKVVVRKTNNKRDRDHDRRDRNDRGHDRDHDDN